MGSQLTTTPKRIVSLQPSVTCTLAELGLLDRVVACTRHCSLVVPRLDSSRISVIEDSWTANATQITSAQPDMVIASVPYGPEAIAQILRSGVRVLALSPRTLDDIYGDIFTIAALMQVPERGWHVVNAMREEIERIRDRSAGLWHPRVYVEEWGKPMLTAQPWVAELVQAAGGEFVGTPASAITAEEVCSSDPEVIVFAWCGTGDRVPAHKLIHDRDWLEVGATRRGRIYVVADQFLTTPAPILGVGLQALAHAIHPEIFEAPPDFDGEPVMRAEHISRSSKQG